MIDVKEYVHDDTVDVSGKTLVVDWYYKVSRNGRTALHYCKFVGGEVLFASENDARLCRAGLSTSHGQVSRLSWTCSIPMAGTPAGFGVHRPDAESPQAAH